MNLRLKEPSVRFITVHLLGNKPTVSQLQKTKKHLSNVKQFAIETLVFGILAALIYAIAAMVFSL